MSCSKEFVDIYGDSMEVVRIGDKVFFGPADHNDPAPVGEFGFATEDAAKIAVTILDLVTNGDC